ncbi:MAG: hypothetical protein LBM77_10380 [Spirochaetaceae bacterium]|jgi:hypothetical protein|nr:hypothetical protein [Spirochaetaceae bacterium]
MIRFNTGLTASEFAKARAGFHLTDKGFILHPNGTADVWNADGVIEDPESKLLVVQGQGEAGVPLLAAITTPLLRQWLLARANLQNRCLPEEIPAPYPCGAFLQNDNVFFPPESFIIWDSRTNPDKEFFLNNAERWIHPDLLSNSEEATVWTGTALLYFILCGEAPFSIKNDIDDAKYNNRTIEILHSDIREGVFTPPRLVKPEINADIADFIEKELKNKNKKFADLEQILENTDGSAFFHQLDEEERQKIEKDRAAYEKRRNTTVKSRRFLVRNAVIISGSLIAAAIIAVMVISYIHGILSKPNTLGKSPAEVVEMYYQGVNNLNTEWIDGSTLNRKVGADYSTAATNFYVTSKMSEAYRARSSVINPQIWKEQGGGAVDINVFGFEDWELKAIDADESDGTVTFEADYLLFTPATVPDSELMNNPSPNLVRVPIQTETKDIITLIWRKDRWLISDIQHAEGGIPPQ